MIGADNSLTFYVQIGSLCTATVGLITVLVTRTWPWLKTKIDSRSVEKHAGAELYPAPNVERTIRYIQLHAIERLFETKSFWEADIWGRVVPRISTADLLLE